MQVFRHTEPRTRMLRLPIPPDPRRGRPASRGRRRPYWRTRPAQPRTGARRRSRPRGTRCALRQGGRSRRDSATRTGAGQARRDAACHRSIPRIGFKPMRCSSMAHSSTAACGKAVATCRHLPQWRVQADLEPGLGHRVGTDVARPGRAPVGAHPPQVIPAGLPAHPAPELGADPGGRGAPASAVALRRWAGQHGAQLRSLLLREQ
jgi:hypothetical protein